MGLDVLIGDARAEQQAARIGRHFEALEPDLAQRIDHHHRPAAALELHERAHEAWVVGGGVAADEHQQVGLVEVGELDRPGAAAEHAAQPHPRGLVAVEGAVVDVVGAPDAREQLEEEPRLVRRAAAEVEEAPLGLDGLEAAAQAREGLLPGGDAVAGRARLRHHRGGEAPQRLQRARGELREVLPGGGGEDVLGDGGLEIGGRGLDRFLAELWEMTGFVDHAAELAAHAQCAGLARVLRTHGLPHAEEARRAGLRHRVADCMPAAACAGSLHVRSSTCQGGGVRAQPWEQTLSPSRGATLTPTWWGGQWSAPRGADTPRRSWRRCWNPPTCACR